MHYFPRPHWLVAAVLALPLAAKGQTDDGKRLVAQVEGVVVVQPEGPDTRSVSEAILTRELDVIGPICDLTEAQRQRLEFAGQGDIRRLLAEIEDINTRQLRFRNEQEAAELQREFRRLLSRIGS